MTSEYGRLIMAFADTCDSWLFIHKIEAHAGFVQRQILLLLCLTFGFGHVRHSLGEVMERAATLEWSSVTLTNTEPPITVQILHRRGTQTSMPWRKCPTDGTNIGLRVSPP